MAWQPHHLSRSQLEERRLHFAQHYSPTTWNLTYLCAYYAVSASTLYRWRRIFKAKGEIGLQATRSTGRPPHLTPAQRDQVQQWLASDALQHGFSDPTWTTRRVRDVIGLRFHVWYHPDHVCRILHRLNCSYQKPDRRALERNEETIGQWIQNVIPDINTRVKQGAILVFLDESGFSLKTTTCRTWAVRGQTPLIKTRMNWDKLSVIGAITSTGKFYQHTVQGAVTGQTVVRFLKHLLRHLTGDVVVVLDNGGIHKSKQVRVLLEAHPRCQLIFLPPYAPELNPIEQVWATVKTHVLGNRLSKNLGELRGHLRGAWQRIRKFSIQAYFGSGMWGSGL